MNRESSFIFWLVVLNLTSAGIIFTFFWGQWNVFFQELLAFFRNASIVFLYAVLVDMGACFLLGKLPVALRVAKIFLISSSSLMFALDLFTIWHYKTTFNLNMLEIAFMTNLRESSEFLAEYLSDWRFLAFISGVILALAILRKIYSFFQRHNIFLVVTIILGTIAGALGAIREYTIKGASQALKDSSAPLRIYFMAMKLQNSRKLNERILNGEPESVNIISKGHGISNVIFILGESTTRNHMALYGYSLPTNPELSRRGNLCVFSDAISPHSHTNAVLREMFTFFRYASEGEWFTYMSLFRILKQAGYHTFWLSNQEAPAAGSVIRMYSRQCDSYRFMDNLRADYDGGASYDRDLLPFLDEAMKNEHEKNFYLVHLLGTHGRYSKRYPPEYSKFSASDEGGFKGISSRQKKTRAEYDNAVLYNDFVVNEIIQRFEDRNAIIFYVSDHGDEVYDSMDFFGHNEYTPSRSMIEIPMIIWMSEKFCESYPDIEARIASSVNRPYMTDDMIYTVLDIMGIETPEYDPAKSIVNPNFDSSRPRMSVGRLYDKETGLHAIR